MLKEEEKNFLRPIDLVYFQVTDSSEIIDSYFMSTIYRAFRASSSLGKLNTIEHNHAYQCHSCSNFYCQNPTFEKHLQVCSSIPGIVYKFENQNLISYEDNFRFLADLPFIVYSDFETTAGSDILNDKNMYPISYCQIFAFHPKLNIEGIVIFKSYHQTKEQLLGASHLNEKVIQSIDSITLNQLKDCMVNVFNKKSKSAISEMFSVELKFTIDCLFKMVL